MKAVLTSVISLLLIQGLLLASPGFAKDTKKAGGGSGSQEKPASESEEESFSPMLEEKEEPFTIFLSPGAEALAKQLGVKPMIVRLGKLQERYRATKDRDAREEIIVLRQQLTDILQYASFQIQDVIAAIDADLAYNDQVYDYLAAKKNKREQVITMTTFMATGALNILNQALGFGSPGRVSNVIGTVSGSTSVGLPAINFIPRRYMYPEFQHEGSNMLAQIFNRPTSSKKEYNSIVWGYLNSAPTGVSSLNGKTRLELLLSRWSRLRQMDFSENKEKLDVLTNSVEEPRRVELSTLVLRGNLLSDVRAEVGALYRELAELKAGIMAL